MYVPLLNEYKMFEIFSPRDFINNKKSDFYARDGQYESGILCSNCDNVILKAYEDYAKYILYGGKCENHEHITCATGLVEDEPNCKITKISNIDYRKFKLFLLSILWRASISSREFFNEIKLKPVEEEDIRKMIYDGDARNENDFPIILVSWLLDESLDKGIIPPPRSITSQNDIHYEFPIGGIIYKFFMSSENMDGQLSQFTLNSSNEVCLLHLPNAIEYFNSYWGIAKNIKHPYHGEN
jgi:hypothetical protein